MPRLNNWRRIKYFSNLEEAEEHLNEEGRVRVAVWTHENDGRVEHIYEPGAEKEFIVRQSEEHLNFEEEGRYEYRYQGGNANKALLRKYP